MAPTPQRLIQAARRRIRQRRALHHTAQGAWVGIVLVALTLGLSILWWPLPVQPVWIALAVGAVGPLAGLVFGLTRPVLDERQLALLLDRALGTDEVLVTLLHLEEGGAASPEILADLERRVAALPSINRGVRVRPPKHALFLPIGIALALLVLLIPPLKSARATDDTDSSLVQTEAERLKDELKDLEDKAADLPEDVREQLDELVDDLENDRIDEDEAQERIQALQDMLKDLEDDLKTSEEMAQDLQEAADALRESGMGEDLADALEDNDLQEAADAMDELIDQVDSATPEQQDALGDAMERAGEALEKSSNQDLSDAGEAMKDVGEAMKQAAKEAKQGQDNKGEPSQSAKDAAKAAKDKMQRLKDKLQKSKDIAGKLKADKDKLKKSQELNGALEGSRQRLGGDPDVAKGQGQGQGGANGVGLGSGMQGQGQGQGQGTNAGTGHTWEDQGTFDTTEGHQDANRQTNRKDGTFIDDFESFYDPVRMKGTDGLVVSVQGKIDESGHMDSLPTRLNEGDETSTQRLLDVPDAYRDAADEALNNERVPPGYRATVKDYFDGME